MFSMRVAVANQYACTSIMQADEQLRKSCEICCNSPRCLYSDCSKCKVQQMHDFIVETLKDSITSKEVA